MNTRSIKPAAWFVEPGTIGTPGFRNRAESLLQAGSAPAQLTVPNGAGTRTNRPGEEQAASRCQPAATGKRHPVIFVPTDFSTDALEAVKLGVTLARQNSGHLVLFHSVYLNLTPYGPANPTWLTAALRREASEKSEPLMNYAQTAGVRVTSVVEEGAQAPTILKSAARWNADMIVLTTRARGWFSRLFRRRTVEHIVRGAKCPVMVLRQDAKR